jgi:hypothetical protein
VELKPWWRVYFRGDGTLDPLFNTTERVLWSDHHHHNDKGQHTSFPRRFYSEDRDLPIKRTEIDLWR